MTYQDCAAMNTYTDLLLEFAGDPVLLAEILEHKTNCPLCQENIREFEERERERINAAQS